MPLDCCPPEPTLSDPLGPLWQAGHQAAEALLAPFPETRARALVEHALAELLPMALLVGVLALALGVARRSRAMAFLVRGMARRDGVGLLCGALLGAFTPICSCCIAPLYAALRAGGASDRAAAAFLFAAPAVNEAAIALVWLLLGGKMALAYATLGMTAALIAGRMAPQWGLSFPTAGCVPEPDERSVWRAAAREAGALLRRMALPMTIGALLDAALSLHALSPAEFVARWGSGSAGPLVAALIGLPLAVNAAAVGPVLLPLVHAGLPAGTLLSLLLSLTVASAAEAAILRPLVGGTVVLRLAAGLLAYATALGLLVNAL